VGRAIFGGDPAPTRGGEESKVDDVERMRPGMEVQLARRREAIAAGMRPRGWKIGLNVKAVQGHFGIGAPVVGWLDGRRVLASGESFGFEPTKAMRVEPEVCLRVGEHNRLEAIAPALEIVDYSTPPSDLFALLASSVLHLATVVGAFAPPERARELGTRWPKLEVTGQPPTAIGEGLVPSDLQSSIDYAAELLGAFGERLVPGDLILAGSYAAGVPPLDRGATALAEFGPLGSVSITRSA